MATITNLDLDIKKGSRRTTVIVTYRVCFSSCERKAGFYFTDRADMYGDDVVNDDRLFRVGITRCYKATKPCVDRTYKRVVANSLLNEDNFLFNWKDEVYARACVTPVQPTGDCANSTIHEDHF